MLQIMINEWYHSEIARELGKCLVKSRALDNYTFYSCNSATKDQCCVLHDICIIVKMKSTQDNCHQIFTLKLFASKIQPLNVFTFLDM